MSDNTIRILRAIADYLDAELVSPSDPGNARFLFPILGDVFLPTALALVLQSRARLQMHFGPEGAVQAVSNMRDQAEFDHEVAEFLDREEP